MTEYWLNNERFSKPVIAAQEGPNGFIDFHPVGADGKVRVEPNDNDTHDRVAIRRVSGDVRIIRPETPAKG